MECEFLYSTSPKESKDCLFMDIMDIYLFFTKNKSYPMDTH